MQAHPELIVDPTIPPEDATDTESRHVHRHSISGAERVLSWDAPSVLFWVNIAQKNNY